MSGHRISPLRVLCARTGQTLVVCWAETDLVFSPLCCQPYANVYSHAHYNHPLSAHYLPVQVCVWSSGTKNKNKISADISFSIFYTSCLYVVIWKLHHFQQQDEIPQLDKWANIYHVKHPTLTCVFLCLCLRELILAISLESCPSDWLASAAPLPSSCGHGSFTVNIWFT